MTLQQQSHSFLVSALARKYIQVIQRYYIDYLNGADTAQLTQLIEVSTTLDLDLFLDRRSTHLVSLTLQTLNSLPEDEAVLLSSIQSAIAGLNVKQIESNEPINLRPLRLDWFRFQTYTSVSKLSFSLVKHTALAKTLNTIAFHSKLVDGIEELLYETSDLSLFW